MLTATEIIAAEPSRAARAPTDVLRLAVAAGSLLVVVVVGALFDDAIVGFVADLIQGIETLPSWLVTSVIVVGQILGFVVLVGGGVVAVVRRNWILLAVAAAAAAVAVLLTLAILPLVDDVAPQTARVDESYTPIDPDHIASTMGLAILTAVVTAASPWVGRRWRRAGWTVVIIATLTRFLGAPIEFDTIVAVLTGWTAGAAAVVALGAPSRRPSGASIAAGLASVGVPLARLEQASLDARGSTPYFATARDGSSLFVKALGEDERSADLMFRIYRRIQPRDLGDEKAFSSLRRSVEHEALVAYAVRDVGVRTPRVVAFANAAPDGYVLAYEAIAGRSLDRLEPGEITDDVLARVWTQLARLRAHRIAHRDLRLANVFLADDGAAWIIDFGFSELAASDELLATDLAELLASSATRVGAERAVAAGMAAVGPEAIVTSLGRLEPARLSGATRSAMKADRGLLPDLRRRLATTAASPGGESPLVAGHEPA
jgi:tRNA A-37 threonylcarbamoyl transferase component Bud32